MPWYTCKVNEVGSASDASDTPAPVVYINLTDKAGAFANTWFYAASGIQQQLLEVGLAAINNCQHVEVAATAPVPGNNPYTEVSRTYGLPAQPPDPPTDFHEISLTPSAENSDEVVLVVGWSEDEFSYVDGFEIDSTYDVPNSIPSGNITYVAPDARTASLTLKAGRTYYIFVIAENLAGSANSNAITVTTPPPPTTTTTSASLIAVAQVGLPTNPSAYGLHIEGNGFGANEMVEVNVLWQVAGESNSYPVLDANGQNPESNLAGYFSVWWSPGLGGLCPYPEPIGTPQPAQYFTVTATGLTSDRTASEAAPPLICP